MSEVAGMRIVNLVGSALVALAFFVPAGPLAAQQAAQATPAAEELDVPTDYVIGAEDVLTVFVWNEPALSGDFVVRPDGKITLPLARDVDAAGLSTDELTARVTERYEEFVATPNVTVTVVGSPIAGVARL